LNFVEKASSSLTGTSDDVDRKWRRSSMPHGVVEYEPQSSKRSSRCDLTCIVPASTGDMRALWTVWPFVRRQGASREGLEIAAGYSTLPCRAHFQTCLRPAPVSCINISEKLMRRIKDFVAGQRSSLPRYLCSDAFGPKLLVGTNR
jgi:hypothetical protein